MASKTDLGLGAIGLLFLGLAVFEFLSGDDWIVWVLLGFLFGGFGAAKKLLAKGD
ncbi:MAG: hypothetical protein HRT64_13760 [Erythrobacter sp.]|nr:hypothetical protein [Erythrobacter sp.]